MLKEKGRIGNVSDGKRIVFVGISIDLCEGCRRIMLVSKEGFCIKCSGRSSYYDDRLIEGFEGYDDDERLEREFEGLRIKRKGEEKCYYEG